MLDRALYTIEGAFNYHLDSLRNKRLAGRTPGQTLVGGNKTQLFFHFWYVPDSKEETKRLMNELQVRFASCTLPIGASVFVRPKGDVNPNDDYSYDSRKLEYFLGVAKKMGMQVGIVTSGMHWTEVAYYKSPLIRMLEQDSANLMYLEDEISVPRKFQPPGQLLRGFLGSDRNGVVYLSPDSEQVRHYRERNLAQMAQLVGTHPEQVRYITTENEVDLPGTWIIGERKVIEPELSVEEILQQNVGIFHEAGIPPEIIYTCQSIEDPETRSSNLPTTNIPGSQIGITIWRTGNGEDYKRVAELAGSQNKNWALVVTNPLSRRIDVNLAEINATLEHSPSFIGFYNWWPHFWGYGIRGMALEEAIKSL